MRRYLVAGALISVLGGVLALRSAPNAGGAKPERRQAKPLPATTSPEPVRPAPARSVTGPSPAPIRFVPVSGEEPARVAPAEGGSKRVVIYLHGFCSDASSIAEWAPSAQKHATLIAPHGELDCDGQKGRFRWGNDVRYIDYRIQRAIRSVSKALGVELERSDVTIAGYSEGADRAQALAWLFPKHYRRAVLMSGPDVPSFDKVRGLDRLAVLRGEREYRRTYRMSAEHFDKAGLPSRFWELPGASHGELGPEAARVMAEVFDFTER